MSITVSERTSRPFKRWWRFEIYFELRRWLRTRLKVETHRLDDGSPPSADATAEKALPPPS
jgi:hypothetical protein